LLLIGWRIVRGNFTPIAEEIDQYTAPPLLVQYKQQGNPLLSMNNYTPAQGKRLLRVRLRLILRYLTPVNFSNPWKNSAKLYGIKSPEYFSLCNFIPSALRSNDRNSSFNNDQQTIPGEDLIIL
jgi:hypothetical protein